jgi:hypothetical protein
MPTLLRIAAIYSRFKGGAISMRDTFPNVNDEISRVFMWFGSCSVP